MCFLKRNCVTAVLLWERRARGRRGTGEVGSEGRGWVGGFLFVTTEMALWCTYAMKISATCRQKSFKGKIIVDLMRNSVFLGFSDAIEINLEICLCFSCLVNHS